MDENRPDVNKTFRRPVDFFPAERAPPSQLDVSNSAPALTIPCRFSYRSRRIRCDVRAPWRVHLDGTLLLLHVRSIARTSSLCMYVLGTPGDETTVVPVYVWSIVFLFYQLDLTYALGAYVQLIHYWLWTLEGEIYRTRRRHGLHFGAVVFEAGRPGGRTTTATIIGEQRLANFCSS